MTKLLYVSRWNPDLSLPLNTEDNNKADFNRFLFKKVPTTKQLQQSNKFENAKRESFVLQLKSRFEDDLEEGKSNETLYTIFIRCSLYLRWCDENDKEAFTKSSFEDYMLYEQTKVMQGEQKRSTYKTKRHILYIIAKNYLGLPHNYFSNIPVMDSSDLSSFEAYTRSDLNQLLPFLRSLFKQTYKQFIQAPEKHIHTYKSIPTMTFEWDGKIYSLCSGITKMMCAGTFLLSYYTYANTSDLFQLKQPSNTSATLGEYWYTMPAFKRRAFKTIHIEIGSHDLEIPKYAMGFFDNLLNASKLISKDSNATLLQSVAFNKVIPMKSSNLQAFLKLWLEKHFTFNDQTGRRLRPVISRFRETGAQITAYNQGDLANNIMLGNTSSTRKKNYSEGNKVSNNGMIQDALSIREEQVKTGASPIDAKIRLGINKLVIEEEYKIQFPDLSRTPNGGSCSSPFGQRSKNYTRRALKQGLAKDGEWLACSDLLACFGCPSQVIVQSLVDIWCLLSFKACIEESLYLHLDSKHFHANFTEIIKFIDEKILPNIRNKLLKQAEKKLNDDGYHPIWDGPDAVFGLIPPSSSQVKV